MPFDNETMGLGGNTPNPYAYPSEVCESCGSEVFVPGVIFKKVPGIMLGTGSEVVPIPIKVAVCAKCGTLSPLDKQRLEEEEKKAKQVEDLKKQNNIIL